MHCGYQRLYIYWILVVASQHFVFCWWCCLSNTHSFLPTLSPSLYVHVCSGLSHCYFQQLWSVYNKCLTSCLNPNLFTFLSRKYIWLYNLFSLFLDIVFCFFSLFFSFLLFSCTDGLQLITYQSSIRITSQMTPLYICAIFTLSA